MKVWRKPTLTDLSTEMTEYKWKKFKGKKFKKLFKCS